MVAFEAGRENSAATQSSAPRKEGLQSTTFLDEIDHEVSSWTEHARNCYELRLHGNWGSVEDLHVLINTFPFVYKETASVSQFSFHLQSRFLPSKVKARQHPRPRPVTPEPLVVAIYHHALLDGLLLSAYRKQSVSRACRTPS